MENPTVQDIFHSFYLKYLDRYTPSAEQAKVSHSIMNCKTGAYGANVSVCEDCGHLQIHYNSCRNRCCPMCQALPTEKWMDAQREDVLEAPYFHVVFTVPQELNPLIYCNQKLLYNALYHSVSSTINELAEDEKYLGAKVGYICILHTLKTLWKNKKLQFHGSSEKYRNHYAFKELINICYEKDWIPHCKKAFNGAQSVIHYLGKYIHRIAISNRRIIRMDEDTVTYYVKDYREAGKWKELTIPGVEFIRRFLMHVPPKRFVRIRHYGLLCT